MKKIKGFMIAIAMIFVLSSCGSSNEDMSSDSMSSADDSKDKYIVGLDDTFAPMGFHDESGELVGFDVELAKDAAKRMGIEIEFQPIDWSMKETELNAGNIDFIWNGYSITPERQEKVEFSDPYLDNRQIIVVMADSDIMSKDDLAGKVITVQGESSALDAMKKDEDFMSKIDGDPIEYATNVECFKDVEAKRSAAIVVDEVLARYYMKQNGEDKYRVLDEDFGKEEFAVGIKKGNTELANKLNKAFKEQKEDGTYDEIYNKWFAE